MKRASFVLCVLLAAARPGASQQFQQVGTGLPGPVVWSEGVEAFDADGDGRVDVLFANGLGHSSPGGPLAPTLLMNQTSGAGPITFADQTATRLPAGFVQQAKGLVVCDVDSDGDTDVMFANAFGNQPSILINDGTGHFTNETMQRFPTILLNSFGGGFGDVDGDGDIDVVFADGGNGGPAGTPKLFLNDGTGHFTNASVQINGVNKSSVQNAQMLDVDNDFDLDVVVDGLSTPQQLYVNDGTGNFTLQTSNTIPAGSGSTYATDWSDLDNDNDIDGFYISLSDFVEGTARNNLVPSDTLSFTGSTATIGGLNRDDDNDVIFLDANNNGIQDVIVGSLSGAREKLYLNAGTFANGSFVYQATGFTTLTDSTLDLAAGDFDDDGRYDVATAQGESGNFTNRVYRNTGAIDTLPPRIGRVETTPLRVPLSTIQNGGAVRRAWIQDATYKRGQTFATASLDVTAVKDGSVQSFSAPMPYVGGGIHRGTIEPAPSPTGTVRMDVTFKVHATDPQANASDSAPVTFRICGAEAYGTPLPNSTGSPALMAGVNDPSITANDFSMTISGLPPNAPGWLLMGWIKLLPGVPYGNGLRFIGAANRVVSANANASGVATIDVDFTQGPFAALNPGGTRYLQFRYDDPLAGGAGFNASDALEITFCD